MRRCVLCGKKLEEERGCTWIERKGEHEWMHVMWEYLGVPGA